MACKHVFNYIGDQKGTTSSTRYFRCTICGCVKVKSDDGSEYIIPGSKNEEES